MPHLETRARCRPLVGVCPLLEHGPVQIIVRSLLGSPVCQIGFQESRASGVRVVRSDPNWTVLALLTDAWLVCTSERQFPDVRGGHLGQP